MTEFQNVDRLRQIHLADISIFVVW